MGLFSFMKKEKKVAAKLTEPSRKFIEKDNLSFNDLYMQFKNELDDIQRICADNDINFDDMLRKSGINKDSIPKNVQEHEDMMSFDFEFLNTTFPNFVERVKKEVKLKNEKVSVAESTAEKMSTESIAESKPLTQSSHITNKKLNDIKIVSSSELGRTLDENLDRVDSLFNSSEVRGYVSSALDDYMAIERQNIAMENQKKKSMENAKIEEAIQFVIESEKSEKQTQNFVKNCRAYSTPYEYVSVIVSEMARIYEATKDEDYSPTSKLYANKLLLLSSMDELERNKKIFSLLVKKYYMKKAIKKLHKGNFANKYANFLGREYQIGDNPIEIIDKYFSLYQEYKNVELKITTIKNHSSLLNLSISEVADKLSLSAVDSFPKYYDYPGKEELINSLNEMLNVIEVNSRQTKIQKICDDLSEDLNFIENSKLYGGEVEFISYVMEQLYKIYDVTKNPKFRPDSINCIKAYCTMSEEQLNSLFEKIMSEIDNKNIKR